MATFRNIFIYSCTFNKTESRNGPRAILLVSKLQSWTKRVENLALHKVFGLNSSTIPPPKHLGQCCSLGNRKDQVNISTLFWGEWGKEI